MFSASPFFKADASMSSLMQTDVTSFFEGLSLLSCPAPGPCIADP